MRTMMAPHQPRLTGLVLPPLAALFAGRGHTRRAFGGRTDAAADRRSAHCG